MFLRMTCQDLCNARALRISIVAGGFAGSHGREEKDARCRFEAEFNVSHIKDVEWTQAKNSQV